MEDTQDMRKLLELYFTNEEFRLAFHDLIWAINQSKDKEQSQH